MKTIGFVIIVIGITMMVYTGFNYVTTKNVIDLGSVKIKKETSQNMQSIFYKNVQRYVKHASKNVKNTITWSIA